MFQVLPVPLLGPSGNDDRRDESGELRLEGRGEAALQGPLPREDRQRVGREAQLPEGTVHASSEKWELYCFRIWMFRMNLYSFRRGEDA